MVAQLGRAFRAFVNPSSLLPAPAGAERDFFGRICVTFAEPRVIETEPAPSIVAVEAATCAPDEQPAPPMIGYFVEIGFRVVPDDVVAMLETTFADGQIHFGRSRWHEVAIDRTLPFRVRAAMRDSAIWFVGEPEYFSDWFAKSLFAPARAPRTGRDRPTAVAEGSSSRHRE